MQPVHMVKTLPEKCRDIIKNNIKKMKLDPSAVYPYDGLTFYFLMSQDCNGGCPYCYQPKQFRKKINLSKKVIDDSMEFILDTFDEGKVKFCLFGGEPTLNFEMVKYLVESYPMLRFQMMTNGINLYKDKEMQDWIKSQSYHFDLTISIEPLRRELGDDVVDKISHLIRLLDDTRGEIYLVVLDPSDEWVYKAFVRLLELGVAKVRVAIVRQNKLVIDERDKFLGLFKRMADYVYFRDEPLFNRTSLDVGFTLNGFRKMIGRPLKPLPPTMCGCGYAYLAINEMGEIYPCDWFANFPEFKVGDIYKGFNDNSRFFYEANKWLDSVYEDCNDCPIDRDIRLCPKAMCLAENYQESGNPLRPTKVHCQVNKIEYDVYDYIAKGCIERGYVEKYNLAVLYK